MLLEKKYLINTIQDFINPGYKFSHISNMNNITIKITMNMTYESYINNTMPMVERRINFIIAENPSLMNSLDR